MFVATVSMKPETNLEASINKCSVIVKKNMSKQSHVKIILFGELCMSAYTITPEALDSFAMQINDDNFNKMRQIAKENNVYLSFGYVEQQGQHKYNAQALISPLGKLINTHRKYNLTSKEKLYFKRGTAPLSINDLLGFKVGTTICYDMFSLKYSKLCKQHRPDIILHSLADAQDAEFTIGLAGKMTSLPDPQIKNDHSLNKTYHQSH